MLSNTDLIKIKIATKSIVQDAIRPLQADITALKTSVEPIPSMQKDLKKVKQDTSKIRSILKEAVGFLDNERSEVAKRVDRIDNYLHFTSTAS